MARMGAANGNNVHEWAVWISGWLFDSWISAGRSCESGGLVLYFYTAVNYFDTECSATHCQQVVIGAGTRLYDLCNVHLNECALCVTKYCSYCIFFSVVHA
jgi:hypothetical protein